MTALLALLAIYLLAVVVIFPIWMLVRTSRQADRQDLMAEKVLELEAEVRKLREAGTVRPAAEPKPAMPAAPAPVITPIVAPAAVPLPPAPVVVAPVPASVPPAASVTAAAAPVPAAEPPLLPPVISPPVYTPPPPKPGPLESLNLEQFMGAKLFAWLGGFALLLGVAFFVKYSFEHELIPASVRAAMGFVFGAGLAVAGLRLSRPRHAVTADALIGAGVVSLYTVTFACRSIYHFEFFDVVPTFLVMTLITAAAFVLAVRLPAQAIAILGMLGGFLTPVLINSGVDNPLGLFGYLAILDVGLIAVALHQRWFHLVPLSAIGTVLLMIGWASTYLNPENAPVAVAVCLSFSAIYFAAHLFGRARGRASFYGLSAAIGLPFVGLAFVLSFLDDPAIASRPALVFGFILACDLFLLALAWYEESLPRLHLLAGLVVFGLLSIWTTRHLTDALLPWALGMYLVFAILHAVYPLLLARRHPAAQPTWWSQLFPPLTLLLLLGPIFKLTTVPMVLWAAILVVDVIAISLALLSASLAGVAAVLVLTLLATGLCILRVPVTFALEPSLLLVIGFFAVFFCAASLWLVRKLGDKAGPGDPRTQLPAVASLLPFLLLIMACARLSVPDPSMVFGLGLLLVILTLGLTRVLMLEWVAACALAGAAALQFAWHARHFDPAATSLPLTWYLAFYATFAVFPFIFRRSFAALTGPWAVAALSGVAHFWMIYQAVKPNWPANFVGALPALFAIAPLLGLVVVQSGPVADAGKRLNQLAWFGGVVLFFVTLIFPIQFERQWLTVAWALEGAALLWLFHRVPHPGLRGTGTVLLLIAFVRLALNPAVLGYHVRGDTPLLNWYLYAYGTVLAACFVAAALTAPPRERALGLTLPPLFNTLGVILAFLLLNIEIADYFTPPGARALAFQFSGNFARDMSYTIGWALFALGLLGAGLWRRQRAARYAAIALLCVALLKLFFHDLARLEALYRIGALFAVAAIAIVASLAYQRYLPGNEKLPPTPPSA
jgi:uncharacterized membrane protein